jgi:hypothetical protein
MASQTAMVVSLESEVMIDGAQVTNTLVGQHYDQFLCMHP